MPKITILCTAVLRSQADQIINSLKDEGFSHNDISLLCPDTEGVHGFAHRRPARMMGAAVVGGTAGVSLAGALGWLTGAGALVVPGIGPLFVAGPIFTPLIDVAVGVAVGGIAGALITMGIPEMEARHLEQKLISGNTLISIHSRDSEEIRLAHEIFEEAGARDISTTDGSEVDRSFVEIPECQFRVATVH